MIRPDQLIRSLVVSFLTMKLFWGCASPPPPDPPAPEPKPAPKPVPVVVIPPSPPKAVSIHSVTYDRDQMIVKWQASSETDFDSYTVLGVKGADEKVDTLEKFMDAADTVFSLERFDPTLENWFWILVTNKSGLSTKGERATHLLETQEPESSKLFSVEYDKDLKIRWSGNRDDDFLLYTIYQSRSEDMAGKVSVKELDQRKDSLYVLPMNSVYYYQIGVEDYWGLESLSNVVKGDFNIKVLDQDYSLINTTELDLSSRQIFGEIPREIGELINLTILRLHINFLSGTIPDEIWKLKKLKILNLSENQLSGEIPTGIHKLVQLEELWLGDNNFSGHLPYQIFTLKHLTHLNVSDNEISGDISESIGSLENLVYLNLWKNNISGFIPRELGDLTQLEFLGLGENNLVGPIPKELGNARSLKSIGIFENGLTGPIPDEITILPELTYLGLFNNQLDGPVTDQLLKKGKMSYLRLNNNQFSGIDHDTMCRSGYNWENPIYFDVSKNEFEDPLPVCYHNSTFHKIYSSY
jgi:Leucine-rich repeat (LRR) protein